MLDAGEYSSSSAGFEAECFTSFSSSLLNKRKSKNKRRFSDEQIKSLETMFESETKLEPRKKLQLARELGLHPRQVAIWFQNKRARWKSKQIERDYSILQANYDNLASQFETLKKENQSLLSQLQKLSDLIDKSQKEGECSGQQFSGNSIDCLSDNGGKIKNEFDVKPRLPLERTKYGLCVLSDEDDSSIKPAPAEYLGLEDEEPELLNIVEPADSSLTSPEEWGSLHSDDLLNQPTTSYQWWDFWS